MKRFLCRGIFSVFVWLNYLINKRHFSSFIFNIFFLLFRISRLFSPIVGRVINELNIVNQIKWKFTQRLICIYFSLSFSFSLHPFSHTSLPLSIWLLLFLSLLTLSLFITCLDLSSHMFLYTLSQWRELCSSSRYLVLYPLSFSLHLCFRSFFLFLNLFWLNTLSSFTCLCAFCFSILLCSCFLSLFLSSHLSLFIFFSICSCTPSFYMISFVSLFLLILIIVMLPLSLSLSSSLYLFLHSLFLHHFFFLFILDFSLYFCHASSLSLCSYTPSFYIISSFFLVF